MPNLGDVKTNTDVRALAGGLVIGIAIVDIGASGAPTLRTGSAPGIAISRSSAGLYSVTYPSAPRVGGILAQIKKSNGTVVSATGTSESPTTGVDTFTCRNAAGTATDPASGDVLWLLLLGNPSSVQ